MRKKPGYSDKTQDPAAAILALIADEVKKAENQNDGKLMDWLELGQAVIEKFGKPETSGEAD